MSLLIAGAAIATGVLWVVPVDAAAMLWGHYSDAENVMTIPTMMASPRYRGVARRAAAVEERREPVEANVTRAA